ncbi:MAG: alpha-D-ribose 1-methylphosphonate 5-triphosphate diphosphatase [Pseudomonadota bacterium]
MNCHDSAPGPSDMVLTNAKLVLENEVVTGSLVVRGENIAAIDQGISAAPGALDCGGDYLSPGLIELHTDNLERHMQPRPGVHLPNAAAIVAHDAELASVGITTVFDAIRIGSLSESRSRYGRYARKMVTNIIEMRTYNALKISHFIHLRAEVCSETLLEELAEFSADDRIGILSVMDHTPGQRQFRDAAARRTLLSGKYNMTDAEIDAHLSKLERVSKENGPAGEKAAVAAAKAFGAVLASHDDTTLDHVAQSIEHGVGLAEFPTTLEAAKATAEAGIHVMMGAPNLLRGGSHSGNVAASDLAEAGCLDILSSDYAPYSLLMAAVRLGQEAADMAMGLARVTSAPAKAAGLDDRGVLRPGLRADLLRFRMLADGTPVTRGAWLRGQRIG